MKKWPWKALMRRPLEQRMRMTASQAVVRARLCVTSCRSFTCSHTAIHQYGSCKTNALKLCDSMTASQAVVCARLCVTSCRSFTCSQIEVH